LCQPGISHFSDLYQSLKFRDGAAKINTMVITFDTEHKKQILDITDQVNFHLAQEKFRSGLCHVFVKHTTAAITTADLDEGGTDQDYLDAFEAMMPKLNYRHPHNPAHVTDHILSSIIGPGITLPVEDGQLNLGTWQRVVLIELDGPREREFVITLISSK
jgi:secondary thiamine-phosphate synthase enzyme